MAEGENRVLTADHWTTDPMSVIMVLLFIGAIANAFLTTLEEKFGYPNPGGRYEWVEVTEDTPLGTNVRTIEGNVTVREEPGFDGEVLGTQTQGAAGVLADGPIVLDDATWWYVDFDEGVDGWVNQDVLRAVDERSLMGDSAPPGTQVAASFDDTEVYQSAGGGTLLGVQEEGAKGRILEGPVTINGKNWWKVDFEDDPDGWVSEDSLERLRPGGFNQLTENTPLGSVVQTVVDSKLYQDPAGAIIGFVSKGTLGELIAGPIDIDGLRWWQVEFENGLSGWVPETVLEQVRFSTIKSILGSVKFWLTVISLIFCALLIAVIVIVIMRLNKIRYEEMMKIYEGLPKEGVLQTNTKWEHVQELVTSDRPAEWRQAILEADIILDEMVTRMGYYGESLGEKLKKIEKSDFTSIDEAWEAHKIRNQIAHEGSDFILTQREAGRVINLYKKVFEEFYYI